MRIALSILIICLIQGLSAQDRFQTIDKGLRKLSETNPGLNETVSLSVSTATLSEFIRGLGIAHSININVDPTVVGVVTNNFSSAMVSDVILFLCKQYDLDIEFVGSIISISKFKAPVVKTELKSKVPRVEYNAVSDFLSLELKVDTLAHVAEMITKLSGKNVILSPDVRDKLVSVFIQNRPFDNTLEKMALANGLKVEKTSDSFYYLDKNSQPVVLTETDSKKNGSKRTNAKSDQGSFDLKIENNKILSLYAANAPLVEVLDAASGQLLKNYFLYSELTGNVTLFIENVTFDQFLAYLLNNTDYTFKAQNGIYLIGNKKLEGLRTTELIQLNNRTIETIIDVIPAELKLGVEIKEFKELNGIIATASYDDLIALKDFISKIDQVVPMVIIEVIIMDVKKFSVISTGVTAGLGNAPTQTTGGSITPGLNMNLNSQSINNIINGINGFGILNLGNVVPDFYVQLQALEENGNIKIRSTPKLATLNGHEASMKIGNTEYYLEVANNVIGSQNPQNIITQTYKSVNADLSVTITPIVSNDEQVTLEIEVEQSDFTGRISQNAPPGSVTRNFKSLVRAKNGDTILLGGLEENNNNETYSGLPGIAKVPVIRWFFGKRTKDKSTSKLNIFIKPTIIY